MKDRYRLNPKEFDIGGTEKFYSDMAEKGWKLVKRGPVFSRFEQSKPEKTRYRIEVVSPKLLKDGSLPEEQIGVYEDCGWEYVTGSGFLHVFRAPQSSNAPEFYLEPQQQAVTLESLRKQYFWSLLSPLFSVILVLLISFAIWSPLQGNWSAQFYYAVVAMPFSVLSLPLLLLGMIWSDVWGAIDLNRLYRRMKKGIPMDHAPTGRHLIPRIAQWVILAAAAACFCMDLFSFRTAPLPEVSDGPYVTLQELGVSGKRVPNSLHHDEESEIEYKRSPFAQGWTTHEYVEGSQWLTQEVYVLKNPALMDRFVESLMYQSTFAHAPERFVETEIEGLDQAWVTERLECIAVKSNMVAILTHLWDTPEEMRDSLEVISQKWESLNP